MSSAMEQGASASSRRPSRFIRSEQKLLGGSLRQRILRKGDCEHFAKDSIFPPPERSSTCSGPVAINKKSWASSRLEVRRRVA